jgi:hypothetical protein
MIGQENDVTLRNHWKCRCHTAPNAVIHFHPCCGPGSAGSTNAALPVIGIPFKALSLFGNDEKTKPADAASSDKSAVEKS